MKVISFIGAGLYQVCRYQYGDKEVETHLFPYAVSNFFTPQSLLVFLTPKAKAAKASYKPEDEDKAKSYFGKLVEIYQVECLQDRSKTYFEQLCELHRARGLVTPQMVSIPNGESETELWEIFKAMADNLVEGEEVVFDITHAFRSLPLLAFIAAAYLRKTKNINLKAMVYGAFEAPRAKEDGTKITPVFDLTPFIELLDWMSATEQFIKTGDGTTLAKLLKQNDTASTKELAHNIKSISQGLHLLRPLDTMQASAQLKKLIEKATPDISRAVPPFAALLSQVEKDHGDFGFSVPKQNKSRGEERRCLLQELKMVDWYERKGQLVHAVCLAREWIVSLLCYVFKLDPLVKPNRYEMENLLNGNEQRANSSFLAQWNSIPEEKEIACSNCGAVQGITIFVNLVPQRSQSFATIFYMPA